MGKERANIKSQLEVSTDNYQRVSAWVESHPGRMFAAFDVAESTGIPATSCSKILRVHPLVAFLDPADRGKPGPQKRYLSMAETLTPTIAGLIEEGEIAMKQFDTLGRQAREEFYRRISELSLNLPRRFRLRKT